jgi:hypothetical protein
LRAALRPGDEGVAAWATLRDVLDLDDIWDPDIHRLLPLVYVNLRDAGVDDPDLPRLKGLYRRTWYLNQLKLAEARPWLELLQGEGIDTLLLKGVPLGLEYYGDLGQRPISVRRATPSTCSSRRAGPTWRAFRTTACSAGTTARG